MSNSHKVFIYEDDGNTGEFSVADLKELLTSAEIFSSKPDICIGAFNQFNFNGLTHPTFVIPGGSSVGIGEEVKKQMQVVYDNFGKRYNYLGVCAGGFLGTDHADIYKVTHEPLFEGMYAPIEYRCSFSVSQYDQNNLPISLQQITDYKSIGPFYPDAKFSYYVDTEIKEYMPYCADLTLKNSQRKIAQLYVAGPVFIACGSNHGASTTQVLASFSQTYPTRLIRNSIQTGYIYNPAAIIASRANDNQGARFLTSTHIETCVKDSTLLKAFEKKSQWSPGLFKEDYELLVSQQEETQKEVVKMLKETFNP